MTASIKLEYVVVEPPGGFIEFDHFCTTSPPACCGVQSSTLPAGYTALNVEFTTYDMPPDARLEKEWCEFVQVCCSDSGSSSGSGQCMTCCADVSPYYAFQTGCCATPLPAFITPSFSGDCDELNNATW